MEAGAVLENRDRTRQGGRNREGGGDTVYLGRGDILGDASGRQGHLGAAAAAIDEVSKSRLAAWTGGQFMRQN